MIEKSANGNFSENRNKVLAIAIITSLAQAVITLRSVFLSNDGFVLSNRRWMEQNLCRHTQESGNRLVPRCNNDIATYSWPISDC